MKKLLLLMALLMVLLLSSCGNKQWIEFQNVYTEALIHTGDGEWIRVEVESWQDYEGEQYQLLLTDGTYLLVSSYNCILINGDFDITGGE